MKLYYAIMSTYCQKVLLAVYEKALEVEKVKISLLDPAARQAYVQDVYALGKIPVLVGDDGHFIPESTIICEYLDQTFDRDPRLFPEDPLRCREARFRDRMCDFYLNNATSTLFFEHIKAEDERDQDKIVQSHNQLNYMLPRLDSQLASNAFVSGDTFTIADCAALPSLFYAQTLHPFGEYTHLSAYFERMQNRPSYARVLQELLPALDAMRA